jgi:hypothetical protein
MIHRAAHIARIVVFMDVGQAYMGGKEKIAAEAIGTLTNVERCIFLPPPALTCQVGAGMTGPTRSETKGW